MITLTQFSNHKKILKVSDIFKLSCLKMHYRIENGTTASFISSLLVRNWTVHQYATRKREVRIIHPNFQSHKNCLRYYLPVLIRETPDNLLQHIFTSSMATFKYHIKSYLLNAYSAVCMKPICLICGRQPSSP